MAENPKQAPGRNKFPLSVVPPRVLAELGAAMLEGAIKYGAFNWRSSKIYYSDYYDATTRHMMQWWEGEDNDHDTGLSHITKAIASLTVLRDAMMAGTAIDDRPGSHYAKPVFVVDPGTHIAGADIEKGDFVYYEPQHHEPWYEQINKTVQQIRERLRK